MYYRHILLAVSIHIKPTVISYQFLNCFSVDDKKYTSLLLRYITARDDKRLHLYQVSPS